MSASKRVGSARRSYALEPVERRVMLSASSLPALPPGWGARPILETRTFAKATPTATDPSPSDFVVGQAGPTAGATTPAQMRGAYGLAGLVVDGVVGDGTGQTIAIVDAYDDPNALADLNTFDAAYNLPAPPSFTKVDQFGRVINGNNAPQTDPAGPEYITGGNTWEGEESLDVQWAHVMAPAANIVLVETDSPDTLFQGVGAAENLPNVSVISMSWSGPEFAGETAYDSQFFQTPVNHQGITFVAATGDYGIYGNPSEFASAVVTPQYPDASPDVVAVGGTTLSVAGNGTYEGETGWGSGTNSFPNGGSGGGISLYEPAPAYQTFVTSDVGAGQRVYPDVSMEGDPATGVAIVDTFDTGSAALPWIIGTTGGTSLATPMFAAVVAIADQVRVSQGLGTLDGPSQTLPHLYELPDNAFHDITTGSNGYDAGPGYDLVTGRGSPVGNVMIADLGSNYIGYHVFDDVNVDGVQEAGESGVGGVTVQLESASGAVLGATTTDADGFYQFLDPAAGSYLVHFVTPIGFQISPVGGATNLVLESTANPATGNAPVTIGVTGTTGRSDDPYANCGLFTETISISDATIQRPQSGTANMTFTVTVSPASTASTFSVPYTTVDGTGSDNTATTAPATVAHDDYQAASGTLVFAPGVTTETITVVIVGNTLIEQNLIFTVQLSPPPSEFDLGDSKTTGTGTIVNTSFPAVSVAATAADTLTRSDTAIQVMLFPVTLSAAAPFPVTVAYTTTDVTAVATVDYLTSTGTLTFTPDASGLTPLTQYISVSILPGTNRQLDKQFALNVAGVSGATTSGQSQVEGTILTNEPPAISVEPGSVTESLTGTAQLPFQIDVAPSLTGPVTISYATADGTAVAGVDYQAVSGTITLAPGRIQQTVFVPVFRQFLSDTTKTLSFTISNPSVAIALETPTVTGTIQYLPVTTLPVSRTQKAIYTDTLGQRVTVGLSGAGTGQVVFLGSDPVATNAYELSFTGTTAASNVTVSASGTGQTTVNSIVVDGSLNALSAKGVNVQGGLVSVSGTVNTLNVGYLASTAVTLGGSAASRGVAINLFRAVDASITSGAPIRSLVAGAFINSTKVTPQYITAPSVAAVRVSGSFGNVIQASGTVGSVQVGGALTGGVQAGQGIGSVVAGSLAGAVLTAGTDGQSGTVATAAFTNAAATIGRVRVRSTFSDSLIAGSHVGTVTMGSVQSSAAGTPFGVVGTQIASVRTVLSGGSAVNVANPQVQFKFEDFEVNLI